MTDLATLSLQRAGLPRFPGATVPDQLVAGRGAALAALQKYVPGLAYDIAGAAAVMREVSAWEERNRASLEQAMASSTDVLPEPLRLTFGSDKLQQFVIAMFTTAAQGMGPWLSGAVDREVQSGQQIQDRWAREDAGYRLQVFGGIVKMDQDGELAKLFVPQPGAASGLGTAPVVVWGIVVMILSLAAILVLYLYSARRLEMNNKLMADLCSQASARGDQSTVQRCVEATQDLQKGTPFAFLEGIGGLAQKLGTAVIAGIVVYVLARWVLPTIAGRRHATEDLA